MRSIVTAVSARGAAAAAGCLLVLAGSGIALALEEGKDEKDNLRVCERRACDIFLKKSLKGDDLKCGLVKTWAKSSIKNGVESGKMSWTSGDARCEMELNLSRPELVTAMTASSHKVVFPEHTIRCAIEEDKAIRNVRVVLSPEVEFKDGVATGGKVRVKKVDAPFLMKTGIWTAATMIDKLGIFEKQLLKELNKLVQKRCPQQYGQPEVAATKSDAAKASGKKAEGEKKGAGEKRVEAGKTDPKPAAKTDAIPDAKKIQAAGRPEGKKAEPAGPMAAEAKEAAKPGPKKTEPTAKPAEATPPETAARAE